MLISQFIKLLQDNMNAEGDADMLFMQCESNHISGCIIVRTHVVRATPSPKNPAEIWREVGSLGDEKDNPTLRPALIIRSYNNPY